MRIPGLNGNSTQNKLTVLALILIGILLAATVVASFTILQPPAAVTSQAKKIHGLYELVLALAMFVFFAVEALIIWAVLRYRKHGDEPAPQVHGNNRLEVGWTAVPFGILAVLFSLSIPVIVSVRNPPQAAAETINVVGHQWFWEFDYPKENITILEAPNYSNVQPPVLVVPTGVTVDIKVTSGDVVHSFYIPHFLYKIQAIPGQVNDLHFRVDQPGEWDGQCAQFCGLHHPEMRFKVQAMSQADFDNWVQQQQKAQPSPTAVPTQAPAGQPGTPAATPAGTHLTITAKNTAFDQASLTASAGNITITFNNQDSGIPHDFAVYKDQGFTQKVDATPIKSGPDSEDLTLNLQPGTYYFRCDVHPDQMKGTLTVQ